MTRTDSLVVGTLVALLALIASLVSVPSLLPTAASSTGPAETVAPPTRPYREGVLGRPVSVSPLSARTQADRDLVALVYSGLVRNGPSGSLVPDLAERWTVDSTGSVWTFYLRDDARWHDGEPVTAEDVAFTIGVLQDPKYTGPGAGSWNEVTVETQGTLTVVFTLKHAPHSLEEKRFLHDAKKIMTKIKDVTHFEQLRQVSPKNDYRFGFSMEFADQAAYTRYNEHPDHVAFVRDRWVPEVETFLEIDYVPLGF